jgi:hypothetical protein
MLALFSRRMTLTTGQGWCRWCFVSRIIAASVQ